MRLPVIRSLSEHISEKGESSVNNTVEVLEHLSQGRGLKDEELELVGELISNLCGSLEVNKMMSEGKSQSEALNLFMKRVMGSIDRT